MDALNKAIIVVNLCAIERALNGMEVFTEQGYEDLIQARIAKVNEYLEEIKGILDKTN